MLQYINDRMKVFGWIVILPLALVFAVWGVHGIVDFTTSQDRGLRVNGQEVDVQRLREVYQRQVAELHRAFPDEIPAELQAELKQSIADQFVNSTLLDQMAAERRFVVSDRAVVEAVQGFEAFQVDGQFNRDSYYALLRQQGIEPAQFEAEQRQALRARQFEAGLALSSFATPKELERAAALRGEQRELAWAVVPAGRFLAGAAPDAAAVQAYYEQHKDRWRTPETVTLSYVALRVADVERELVVDEAGLKDFYAKVQDRYVAPERRRARHILIQSGTDDAAAQKRAQALYEQARAPGADFAALARANSEDAGSAQQGGDLGFAERSFFVGPFADAVFGMQVGELRGPVKTEFGWHVIRLEEVQAGHRKAFEEARAELEAEFRRNEAERIFGERQERLDTLAFENTTSLEPVAKELGLEIRTIPGFSKTEGGGEFVRSPLVTQAAFSADVIAGQNSRALELEPGNVVVLRAADHRLPETQPLEAVRAEVEIAARAERAAAAARAAAGELAKRLQAGDPWESALRGLAPVVTAPTSTAPGTPGAVRFQPPRFVVRGESGIPSEVLAGAFRQPRPADGRAAVATVALGSGDQVVYAVTATRPGTVVAQESALEKQALAAAAARADVLGYLSVLRARSDIHYNPTVFD